MAKDERAKKMLYLPQELADEIESRAKADGRSFTSYVQRVLETHLKTCNENYLFESELKSMFGSGKSMTMAMEIANIIEKYNKKDGE